MKIMFNPLNPHRPLIAVDAIILLFEKKKFKGIILVERKFEPKGLAFPGGIVEYGETLEECVKREVEEETSLKIKIVKQLHTYSDPKRDKRFHCIGTAFLAKASGKPKAGDDAKKTIIYSLNKIPKLCFDHNKILRDSMKEIKKAIK